MFDADDFDLSGDGAEKPNESARKDVCGQNP
jgi:hypothetical protein